MKSNIFSIGSYLWLFLQDFPQQRLLVETLMLIKSARSVSREVYLEKRVYIGLSSYS